MKPVHSKSMRVLSIALITLAFTTSLLAQGQLVEGSMEIQRNVTSSSTVDLQMMPPEFGTPSSSVWLPPRILSASGNLSLLEASRATSEPVLTFSPLPPTPLIDSSGADLMEASRPTTLIDQPVTPLMPQAPVDNSFSIQAVPEPSTLALGGLALGLIAIARNKSARIERIKK